MRMWKARPVQGAPTVGMAVACYLYGKDAERRQSQLLGLLASLQAQTYPHWKVRIAHDGEDPDSRVNRVLGRIQDPRIGYVIYPERKKDFGHSHRKDSLQRISSCDYGGFCNDDAWFAPVFFEALLNRLTMHGARLAYCDMVHSHTQWRPVSPALQRGKIDVGGWLADRKLLEATPWESVAFNGDGIFVEALAKRLKPGEAQKVPHVLYVHN